MNDNDDPFDVSADAIRNRILQCLDRLEKMREQRLQPLIDRLSPQQRDDHKRAELRLGNEMDEIEMLTLKANSRAWDLKNNERLLDQQERRDVVKKLVTLVNMLDDFLRGLEADLDKLEQQQ